MRRLILPSAAKKVVQVDLSFSFRQCWVESLKRVFNSSALSFPWAKLFDEINNSGLNNSEMDKNLSTLIS